MFRCFGKKFPISPLRMLFNKRKTFIGKLLAKVKIYLFIYSAKALEFRLTVQRE